VQGLERRGLFTADTDRDDFVAHGAALADFLGVHQRPSPNAA
jgi:hypothetical protein